MIETMLDKYLKRKGVVIVDPDYKNKIETFISLHMINPGENEDKFIERVIKSFDVRIIDICIQEKESEKN